MIKMCFRVPVMMEHNRILAWECSFPTIFVYCTRTLQFDILERMLVCRLFCIILYSITKTDTFNRILFVAIHNRWNFGICKFYCSRQYIRYINELGTNATLLNYFWIINNQTIMGTPLIVCVGFVIPKRGISSSRPSFCIAWI